MSGYKTRNAFALRGFDFDKWLAAQIALVGLSAEALTKPNLKERSFAELQQLKKQYQQLQQNLTDFRERRIVRHGDRLQKYSSVLVKRLSNGTIYTYSKLRRLSERTLELSNRYAAIARQIIETAQVVEGIIYHIEQEQEGYILRIFSKRLKEARKEAGITQTELAKRLGTTQRAISHYENRIFSPSLYNLVQLSVEFGKPPGWFLGL